MSPIEDESVLCFASSEEQNALGHICASHLLNSLRAALVDTKPSTQWNAFPHHLVGIVAGTTGGSQSGAGSSAVACMARNEREEMLPGADLQR